MPSHDEELEEGEFESDENQEQSSSEFIKPTKGGRKQLCDTCTNSLSKYTCPGCGCHSCSLACINRHKSERECSGKAAKNSYVDKTNIDESVVKKDYEFVKSML